MQQQIYDLGRGSAQKNLDMDSFGTIKIPLPPLDVQKSIVAECEAVDSEYQNAQMEIADNKNEIAKIMANVKGEEKKLAEIAPYGTGRIAYKDIISDNYVSTDNLLQNCEGLKIYEGLPNVDSIIRYEKGDILVSNIRPYLKKIWLADKDGGCSPDVLVFRISDKSKDL